MSHHYPKGYEPQTYGERELADSMTTNQIQREIDNKAKLKKENPKKYKKKYMGFSR
jgi:hypothetical protein